MNIGIDARMTHYRMGGISTYIINLIRQYERLEPSHHITVFQSRKAEKTLSTYFERANLWTPCHHRIERTALGLELSRFPIDVFHSPDFIPPRIGAKHYVISIHDLSFMYYPEYMTADSQRYYKQQIQTAAHKATHILTISEATKQDIMTLLDIPESKITVHWLGVDEEFYPRPQPEIDQLCQNLKLPKDYILFVGTFEPRKNIPTILEAYQQLQKTIPDTPPLVLAGNPGWLFDETLSHIKKMDIESSVYLRTQIPQHQLPALYSGALVHVMPSFYEGFGLPALEAMACGTPTIVSNRSSLPEVVGNVGLQIDPDYPPSLANALYHVITDSTWRTQQSEAAQKRAKHFNWKRTAQIALHVYEKAGM